MRLLRTFCAFALVALARVAVACPSCYSNATTGSVVDGTNTAILFMLGVTGFMLSAIVFFFIMMRRRTRRLFDHTPGAAFLTDQGILQWKNT